MIAALYVQEGGVYDIEGIDLWGISRDAKQYKGPYPVIAHPPCKRWGKFWHGSPSSPHRFLLGDDDGMFAHSIWAVRTFGGVPEHPAHSHAWRWFGLEAPSRLGGWIPCDDWGGWTCAVWQGHYGHPSPKATWLYAHSTDLPELIWGKSTAEGRVEGMGKKGRAATPVAFRDVLIEMAESAY